MGSLHPPKMPLLVYSAKAILLMGSMFAFAFLLNFFWEAFHSVYLYEHHNFKALRYFRMLVYVALIDALFLMLDYLGVGLLLKDLHWVRIRRFAPYLLFAAIGLITAYGIEMRAVYFLHRWRYSPAMPLLLGVGVSPLVQLSITGLISAALTHALFYRSGFFSKD